MRSFLFGVAFGSLALTLPTISLAGGITIVTHGFNADMVWVDAMANAIASRAGTPGVNVTRLNLVVTQSGSNLVVTPSPVAVAPESTFTTGEFVIGLDWTAIDSFARTPEPELPPGEEATPTQNVAQAVFNYLETATYAGKSMLAHPFHLIGHSRGGALVASLARSMGERGVWADHLTTLDPVPVSLFGDAAARVVNTVVFADNIWQNVAVPSGSSLAGAFNQQMGNLGSSNHSRIHTYYYGTIDPLASGPSLTGPTQINVATYDTPPDAKQNGTTDLLDTGDCRTQDPWYASGSIYLCHGNTSDWGTAASIEAVVRSYRINSASNAVTWTSDFGQDTVFYFHPAIAANSLSEAYIVFTASGDDRFAQTRHSGRQPADGSMQGSSLLHTSTTFYNPTGSSVERWGDYSGMAIDPNGDERGAWLFNQYSDTTTTWSTRIGGISFGLPSVRHLASGSEESYSAQERYFTFNVSGSAWTTIGIDKTGGAADDDADIAASNSCGFSPYQNATLGNTVTDFIAANGIDYGASTHTARVYANSGTLSSYRIETRAVATTLNPTSASASAGSFIATDLLDNYQASVVNGKTYAAVLDITGNTANYDLFRFASTRLNGRRFVNDGESDSAVNGATETILFTAGATGTDGFVVVNNNAVAGDYTMRLFLKPLVSAVGTVNPCSASLMTYPMSLVEGTSPTWSFTTAVPAGMVINSTTGVISWPVPRAGLYNVTVRATNPAGFDDEALTFRFDCAADFNCDNQVDDADFVLFLAAYNILVIPPANPKFDLTNDGLVEDADFQIFIQQYDDLVCP